MPTVVVRLPEVSELPQQPTRPDDGQEPIDEAGHDAVFELLPAYMQVLAEPDPLTEKHSVTLPPTVPEEDPHPTATVRARDEIESQMT